MGKVSCGLQDFSVEGSRHYDVNKGWVRLRFLSWKLLNDGQVIFVRFDWWLLQCIWFVEGFGFFHMLRNLAVISYRRFRHWKFCFVILFLFWGFSIILLIENLFKLYFRDYLFFSNHYCRRINFRVKIRWSDTPIVNLVNSFRWNRHEEIFTIFCLIDLDVIIIQLVKCISIHKVIIILHFYMNNWVG